MLFVLVLLVLVVQKCYDCCSVFDSCVVSYIDDVFHIFRSLYSKCEQVSVVLVLLPRSTLCWNSMSSLWYPQSLQLHNRFLNSLLQLLLSRLLHKHRCQYSNFQKSNYPIWRTWDMMW